MRQHRRDLPHYYPPESTLFVTWCLFGVRQGRRPTVLTRNPEAGKQFAAFDSEFDNRSDGPQWLRNPTVAQLIADALTASDPELYQLHAWVIMPNHVHIVIRPTLPLPVIMRRLKGATSRAANQFLNRTGHPFWQYEYYDHCIRTTDELNHVIRYVERNPVAAGLAPSIDSYRWSGANAS